MRTCPTCGEQCAQLWCGFCERMLPLEGKGCAFGQCTDPNCYLCVEMQEKFRVVPCETEFDDGQRCRFVAKHHGPCLPPRQARSQKADTRDGMPAVKRRDPTFTRRPRVGPHR